jgi:DNA polymerase/3'-5' exonuclease PolX
MIFFKKLGWTGSRQFNRSIRLYSEKEFNYRLTSHGIFDHKNVFIAS